MALKPRVSYIMVCDVAECGATFVTGNDGAPDTAMGVRAAAYVQGWRYPPKTMKGRGHSARSDDQCPSCVGVA